MADTTWPITLPLFFDVNGYNEKEPKNSIRQKMGVGPDKVRRRSTAKPRPINGQMVLTMVQVETMSTFYNSTLFSGVLSFDGLPHPRTRAAVDWHLVEEPDYTSLGRNGTLFVCTMKLEILP